MADAFRKGADNPKDPLRNTIDTPSKDLMRLFADVAHNFGQDAVIAASSSILLSAVRQVYPTRAEAEKRFDDVVGRTKQTLMECYDSATGKRRNIFPHTQTMRPALAIDPDAFLGAPKRA